MPRQLQMQRRHFERIAATVRELPDNPTRDEVAAAFVRALKPTNPKFEADRFREACSPEARQ